VSCKGLTSLYMKKQLFILITFISIFSRADSLVLEETRISDSPKIKKGTVSDTYQVKEKGAVSDSKILAPPPENKIVQDVRDEESVDGMKDLEFLKERNKNK